MSEIHEVAPFDLTKKKKKKRVNLADVNENSNVPDKVSEVGEEGRSEDCHSQEPLNPSGQNKPTAQDYLYEELLDRIYGVVGIKSKTAMRLSVPEVLRQGTKKTVLVNFLDFCKTMHRSPEHLQGYLEAELASNSAVDGKNQLVINGRFQVKHIESILRRYAGEYVLCYGCKSPNTVLSKENRLMFVQCEECGSSRTVAPIKRGFEAPIRRVKNAR
ncbi:hypothetical protein RND81_12G031100 [Saponaria officinalis]|uniref:Eukaryotic translation initiation factor 2 subunit beta n=1 Tax=Saponaria officinalis TaxID=3572 RepID=A0AAW1H664_SAPOF